MVKSKSIETSEEEVIDLNIQNHYDNFESVIKKASDFYREINQEGKKSKMSLKFLSPKKEITYVPSNNCKKRVSSQEDDFYDFFPSYEGKVTKEGDTLLFQNFCGSTTKLTLTKLSKEESVLTFDFHQSGFLCSDLFIVSQSKFLKVKFLYFFSTYTLRVNNLTDDDMDEIRVNGIRIFKFCQQHLFNVVSSYFHTMEEFGQRNPLKIFDNDPNFQEKAVFDFLDRYINFPQVERKPEYRNSTIEIDENLIQTGDHFSIGGHSLYAAFIQFGDLGQTNHAAFACRFNNTLYVCESNGMLGVRKIPYKAWLDDIKSQNESVVFIPLSKESREKFNETKALEFFNSVDGFPWGTANFLFTFFDTPSDSMPPEINSEFILTYFTFFSKKGFFEVSFLLEPLNYRLGTKNLTLSQVIAEGARRGHTFEELLAMPEKDNIQYEKGISYACSALNIAFWKAGGLFGDMEINASEFTVRDVYELNIFDPDVKNNRPEICKQADPDLDFCQIIGRYSLPLPYFNTVKPYPRMNERCPRLPLGQRLEGC